MESAYSGVIKQIIETARSLPGYVSELKNIGRMIEKETNTTDEKYMTALLFPEFSTPARVPSRFSLPSSVFQVTQTGFIVPDTDGSFGAVLLPKVMGYSPVTQANAPPGYNGPVGGLAWAGNQSNMVDLGNFYLFTKNYQDSNWGVPTCVAWNYVPTYYQSARLTACSINIQYIGAYESTSGFLSGGLNYSYIQGTESIMMVQDSYYVQNSFTGEGFRGLWLPRDNNDTDYTNFSVVPNGDFSQALCIYGSNLPQLCKLRWRLTCNYEGLPWPQYRDYMETQKATSSDSTMKLVSEIHNKGAPLMASLNQKDAQKMYNVLGDKFSVMDQLMDTMSINGNQLWSNTLNTPIMLLSNNGKNAGSEEIELWKQHAQNSL